MWILSDKDYGEPGTEEAPKSDSSSHLLERGCRRGAPGLCVVSKRQNLLRAFLCFHGSPRLRCWLTLSASRNRIPQSSPAGRRGPDPKVLPDDLASCSLSTFARLPCCSPFWRSWPLGHSHLQPYLHSPEGIRAEQYVAGDPGAVVRSGPWAYWAPQRKSRPPEPIPTRIEFGFSSQPTVPCRVYWVLSIKGVQGLLMELVLVSVSQEQTSRS